MNMFVEKFKEQFRGSFQSQDSKYFIFTAAKITIVPLISFGVIFYSLWTIMEMNFNFFAANGFLTGEGNKETFYDAVLLNITDYFLYFGAIISGIYLVGLVISYFALSAFSHIENFIEELEDDFTLTFNVKGFNQSKLINQSSRIFFKYLELYAKKKKAPKFKLPKNLQNLKSPPMDKVFFFQYLAIVGIICLVTSFSLYSFTHELYQEIVAAGINLLPGNTVVANFLLAQESILFNVYSIAIATNILLYLGISKNIIKAVDGVSYGFTRDLLQVINGNHSLRLRPRANDPGKELAASINSLLDEVFYEDSLSPEEFEAEYEEAEPEFTAQEISVDAIKEEFDDEEYEYEDSVEDDSEFDNVHSLKDNDDFAEEVGEEDELPPAFIEEKQVANGEKIFQVTTPTGMKLEGLNEDLVLKLVKEMENKK